MELDEAEALVLDCIKSSISGYETMHIVKIAIIAKLGFDRACFICHELAKKGLIELDRQYYVSLPSQGEVSDREVKRSIWQTIRGEDK